MEVDFGGILESLERVALFAVPFLFSLSFHEAAHAWMANRLGDPTAKHMGRLTLNPLAHIDWVWTVIIPAITLFFGGIFFGAAKPVPFDPRNLKDPIKDTAMVAFAGPLSNFLLALIFTFLMALSLKILEISRFDFLFILVKIFGGGILINLFLAFFNLIPLVPLDGSKIIRLFLNYKQLVFFDKLAPYSILIIIVSWQFGLLSYLVGTPAFAIYRFLVQVAYWLV